MKKATLTDSGRPAVLDTDTGELTVIEYTYRTIMRDQAPDWKTPWNHDTDAESLSTGLQCKDPSRTQQQFAKEADINQILAKFQTTGELPVTGQAHYADVTDNRDLQDRIVTAWEVEQAWNELPAAARNILKDPRIFADYVDHCVKTGDIEPLRELGLAPKLETPPPATPEPPQAAAPPGGGTPAPSAAKEPPSGSKS